MARWRLPVGGRNVGSPAAFDSVVLPHLDAAYNIARWLVGDATLAEDVVQDAAVRALRYFETYRGGDAKAWLLRIVRNVAREACSLRHRDRSTSLDAAGSGDGGGAAAPDIPDPADDPEAALFRQQRHATLEAALAALPLDLRECLVLRELEQLPYREIAQVTGVPVGTVMSRLWRARQALALPGCVPAGPSEGQSS